MKTNRIYQNRPLKLEDYFELDSEVAHRLITVLRLKKGDPIIIFNGDGFEYLAIIISSSRSSLSIKIIEKIEKNLESPLKIHIGQVMSKGEKMDFVIQKSTELGVTALTPLISERTVVRLNEKRLDHKNGHFRKIAIHASEQCGRTQIPSINKTSSLQEWVTRQTDPIRLILAPTASQTLKAMDPFLSTYFSSSIDRSVTALIGPEGGFSEAEIEFACQKGFQAIRLGPRILRTETAAITLIAALQCLLGDLA